MASEKTIKQLADELGVSKQAIQKRINNLPNNQQPSKVGGKYVLSEDLVAKIKSFYIGFDNCDNQQEENTDNVGDNYNMSVNVIINDLKMDKEYLQSELSIRNTQIEKLQKLLDQQQILTLQANKKIEELELKNESDEKIKSENDHTEEKKQDEYAQNFSISEDKKEKKSPTSFWEKIFRKGK